MRPVGLGLLQDKYVVQGPKLLLFCLTECEDRDAPGQEDVDRAPRPPRQGAARPGGGETTEAQVPNSPQL